MSNGLTFLSTFTGVGGFDAGFEAAGMKCIGQCEIDRWANMVLRYHWPDIKRINDVKEINGSTFPIRPDIICGGFPCQDLSVAGKRAGLAGGRSGLFFEFERIVAEFKPDGFILENVPGLLSSNEKQDFATVLRRLGQCGYLQAYRVFDSQYFGVAQRRRRVFIVGSLGNGRCAEILFEPESLPRDPAKGRKTGERVAATISQRSQGRGYGDDELNGNDAHNGRLVAAPLTNTPYADHISQENNLIPETVRTLSARNDGSPCIDRGPEVIAFCHRDNGRDATENLSPTLRCFNPKSKGVNLPVGGMAVCFEARFVRNGRGAPESIVPPLKAECGKTNKGDSAPLMAGPFGVRRLTPRECERLQGFPSIKKQIRISICLGPQKKCADAEIKNHKSLKPVGNAGKSRLSGSAPSAEQNLNQKNLNSNKHAHPNVHINLEGKKVEILNQEKQKLFVSTAANPKWYHRHIAKVDFVHLVAFISSTLENITRSGRVEFQQNEHYSIHQKNGETCVELYGKNLMQLAEFAEKDSTTLKKLLNSTTYCHGNTSNIASILTTSFSHVILAIIGFTQNTTRTGNTFTIQINTEFGWTRWGIDEKGYKVEISDTQRYKMCGNAVTESVAEWIGERIMKA